MLYKDYQDIKLSGLGLGMMRLPVIDGDDTRVDETAAAEMIDLLTGTESTTLIQPGDITAETLNLLPVSSCHSTLEKAITLQRSFPATTIQICLR